MDSAKSDIKNNKNSESQIDKLQSEIDKLKQKEETMPTLNSLNFIKNN